MTKDEALAMDLALEALEVEQTAVTMFNLVPKPHITKAITAIKQARSAPAQEPVAWMHTMIDDVVVGHRPADLNVHPDRWMPLYKDPTPCKTCEALARTVMMDQTAHDTTPPAAPVQEPVAFKIYKPTPPRLAIPNVRDAELPWVYDQDPSSGNVASMWVTPVKATPTAAPVQEPVAFNAGVPPLYPEMKDGETISVEYTTPPGGRQSEDCLTAAQEDIQRLSALVRAQQITIDKLEQARSAPVQEPLEYWNAVEGWVKIDEVRQHFDSVGCGTIYKNAGEDRVPLYTAAQRKWVGLTQQDIDIAFDDTQEGGGFNEFARAIEQRLKEKNT